MRKPRLAQAPERRGQGAWARVAQGWGREGLGQQGWATLQGADLALVFQTCQRISSLLQEAKTQAALVLGRLEERQE